MWSTQLEKCSMCYGRVEKFIVMYTMLEKSNIGYIRVKQSSGSLEQSRLLVG